MSYAWERNFALKEMADRAAKNEARRHADKPWPRIIGIIVAYDDEAAVVMASDFEKHPSAILRADLLGDAQYDTADLYAHAKQDIMNDYLKARAMKDRAQ